MTRLVFPTAVP